MSLIGKKDWKSILKMHWKIPTRSDWISYCLRLAVQLLLPMPWKQNQSFPKTIFSICRHIPNIDILDANTSEMSRDSNKNVINCLELKTEDQSCVWHFGKRRGRQSTISMEILWKSVTGKHISRYSLIGISNKRVY